MIDESGDRLTEWMFSKWSSRKSKILLDANVLLYLVILNTFELTWFATYEFTSVTIFYWIIEILKSSYYNMDVFAYVTVLSDWDFDILFIQIEMLEV